ncbi:MAG TPA: fused MFS/spermidine synthase, partial [Burkholderiaceae bacterium]|nr:fused MFS/spermidine synthase [Burkholderiaceae bacterium]
RRLSLDRWSMSAVASAANSRPGFDVLPYAGTIFLSAFLLFLVQPIIAKQILPWFGGSSAVWTTALVFFQSILLAGYAYADLTTRMGVKRQTVLHVGLLVLSLATLPILASAGWKPRGDEEPILRILLLLTLTIGMPYFLLSTTTPLLQSWYWQRFGSVVPYRLFALSNFASLLALLGFPFIFEPWFGLIELAWAWSIAYGVFVLVCAVTAWASLKAAYEHDDAQPARHAGSATTAAPSWSTQLTWLALAAMGSIMLLAVTNHVTQNIASVPFLWVLPLSIYLLTFILTFDHPRWYRRWLTIAALAVLAPTMASMISSLELKSAVPVFFAGLFVACMFCHGELAKMKPDPRWLTRFYLMLSVGGALGAVLIAIVAPLMLRGYFEVNIALVLLALLLSLRLRGLWRLAGVAIFSVTAFFAVHRAQEYSRDTRIMERDFYGVVRTRDRADPAPYRSMLHGAIVHGGQLLGDAFRNQPSDYFGPSSGYGRLFETLNALHPRPRKVGIIGLGAGVLASYGRKGDEFVFYEISPRVVDVANDEFTFLRDSAAKILVVLGDGRLSLERAPPQRYDVLGIDAFAGDSIPMHLVTREAMALYVRHLAENGVIVFQATNRYIDIMPVVKRLASEFGMQAVLVSDVPGFRSGPEYWLSPTDQILVTRDKSLLQADSLRYVATPIEERADLKTFTDAHHNLFRVLK